MFVYECVCVYVDMEEGWLDCFSRLISPNAG